MGSATAAAQGHDPLASHGAEEPEDLGSRETRQSSDLRIGQRAALAEDGLHAKAHGLGIQWKLAIGLRVAAQEVRQISGKAIGRSSPPPLRGQVPPRSQGDKPGGSFLLRQLKALGRRPPVQESSLRRSLEGNEVIQVQASACPCLGRDESRKSWVGSGRESEADHAFVRVISRHPLSEPKQLLTPHRCGPHRGPHG